MEYGGRLLLDLLNSIIDFLNNSGAITVIAAVVLAGITYWYVRVTKK